jgi:hypothetical protein
MKDGSDMKQHPQIVPGERTRQSAPRAFAMLVVAGTAMAFVAQLRSGKGVLI